jgi:hypothetical protein
MIAFIALLNQIGLAMVDSIAGAETLYEVRNTKLPKAVAILIICLCAAVISTSDYKQNCQFELYCFCDRELLECHGLLSHSTLQSFFSST